MPRQTSSAVATIPAAPSRRFVKLLLAWLPILRCRRHLQPHQSAVTTRWGNKFATASEALASAQLNHQSQVKLHSRLLHSVFVHTPGGRLGDQCGGFRFTSVVDLIVWMLNYGQNQLRREVDKKLRKRQSEKKQAVVELFCYECVGRLWHRQKFPHSHSGGSDVSKFKATLLFTYFFRDFIRLINDKMCSYVFVASVWKMALGNLHALMYMSDFLSSPNRINSSCPCETEAIHQGEAIRSGENPWCLSDAK